MSKKVTYNLKYKGKTVKFLFDYDAIKFEKDFMEGKIPKRTEKDDTARKIK